MVERVDGGVSPDQGGGGGPPLPEAEGAFVLPVLGLRRGGILGANGFSPPAEAEAPSSELPERFSICAVETISMPSRSVSPVMAVSMPLLSPLVTRWG